MNATVLKLVTRDCELRNLVIHQCSCGEFLKDLRREVEEFRKGKDINNVDLFWHIDEYCNKKYGRCPWQTVSLDSLMYLIHTG